MRRGRDWVATVLKRELAVRVRRVVEANLGYRSVAEFVNDAVRRRLEEMEPFLEKLSKAPARLPAGACAEQGEPIRGDEPQIAKKEAGVVVGG